MSRNYEGNRSWGAPSRGVFGEGATAVVEGSVYLDYHQGKMSIIIVTPTAPIRSSVSLLFVSDFYPSFPSSAISEEEVFDIGVFNIYRGVDALAVV